MILRFRNLDLSIGRILKFVFLLKIKIRQQDGFLLELNLTFEESVLKFLRQIDKLHKRKEWFFDMWTENPEMINAKLKRFIDLEGWKMQMRNCNKLYEDRGYKFMKPRDIIKDVDLLLLTKQEKNE